MVSGIAADTIRLTYKDKGRTVLIQPDDRDRFCTTVQKAIAACQESDNAATFFRQFEEELLRKLAMWVASHREKIKDAYVTVRDAGLLFLIVQRNVAYDRDFEDALTELDLQIAGDPALDRIKLSVLALPKASEEAVRSFLMPAVTLRYAHA